MLLLKPLSAALQDGDRVHSVIRASGLNQDGKTPTISSPSMDAQVKLIEETYRRAGLDIRETGYVEAHVSRSFRDPFPALRCFLDTEMCVRSVFLNDTLQVSCSTSTFVWKKHSNKFSEI